MTSYTITRADLAARPLALAADPRRPGPPAVDRAFRQRP
jgi:hypothetical protein